MQTLGIDDHARQRTLSSLTDSELENAFKFKAFQTSQEQADPADDQNILPVETVHEAYNILMKLKSWREEDKRTVMVHYSATIKKGPPGEGFGMIVNVNDRRDIYVKKVLSCLDFSDMTHNGLGNVRVNDEILGIDGESTSGWSLARLVQRLNDFRVPVGSGIRVTFQRRLRVDGDGSIATPSLKKGVKESDGLLEPEGEGEGKGGAKNTPSHPVSTYVKTGGMDDIDDDSDDEYILSKLNTKRTATNAEGGGEATSNGQLAPGSSEVGAGNINSTAYENRIKKLERELSASQALQKQTETELRNILTQTEVSFSSNSMPTICQQYANNMPTIR